MARISIIFGGSALILCFILGIYFGLKYLKKWRTWDSTIWEWEIERFEKADKKSFPEKNLIIFTGSSTIRLWKSLSEDMAPLKVLNRGFGGSRIPDVLFYFDRLVLPYKPKAIVFYCGENDMDGLLKSKTHSAIQVRDDFNNFCDRVHQNLGEIPIFYISMKPPKKRVAFNDEIMLANKLIKESCESNQSLHFIDIVPILSENGKIKEGISRKDGIHLNDRGYELIIPVIKSNLMEFFST